MSGFALAGVLLLAPVAASGCSRSITPTFEVFLGVQKITIGSNVHAADLAAMATRSHAPLRHPAYGYYVGTFGYTVKVMDQHNTSDPCPHDMKVRVLMGIAGRHIEMAQELRNNRCLYSRYLDHYKKHASSDVVVVADFRSRVAHALQSMTMRAEAGSNRSGEQILDLVRTTIDDILISLTSDRVAISREVDNPSEVEVLERGCSHSFGIAAVGPL